MSRRTAYILLGYIAACAYLIAIAGQVFENARAVFF